MTAIGDLTTERFMVIPGWGGSNDDHWQRIWARADPRFDVVEQDDWDNPNVDDWIERLDRAVHASGRPAVLVAHSLGCHLVARWAEAADSTPIRAALFVAPPDIEFAVANGADPIAGFGPVTTARLPFPSILAASHTDPWARIEWTTQLAQNWGAEFVDLGDCGHVNVASGHGSWPDGLELLRRASALA
jgi:predicted alpha/beta hydrolase family esterase